MSHTKIYSGSEILAAAVATRLDDAGIPSVVRNNLQSGNAAGFGNFGLAVDVLVDEPDITRAKEIVASFEQIG